MDQNIIIRGAAEHNLKGVDLTLPRDSLIVFTGVSGSGKSSLAFDTIFQEGQRRFMESLSAYARQFLGQMEKPRVDHIEGLSPTICIDQKTINRNPRSTVGTITEIYDHLRLLFARLGTPHCPQCGRPIARMTPRQICDALYLKGEGKKGMILAPIVADRKGEYRKELADLYQEGWLRARIDGQVRELSEEIALDRYVRHTIEVVMDRVVYNADSKTRIVEALEKAIQMTGGTVSALVEEEHLLFATERACPTCNISIPELEPRVFSFNSPHGACPTCSGLGEEARFHPDLVVPRPELAVDEGAITCLTREGRIPFAPVGMTEILQLLARHNASPEVPWRSLPEVVRKAVMFGDTWNGKQVFDGIIPVLERSYHFTKADFLERFIRRDTCRACGGKRLAPITLAVKFRGQNIWDVSVATVDEAWRFFSELVPDAREELIGREIFKEILSRLYFLREVGLGYISLDRSAATLAGGEAQRIRLASQVGSGLQGVLYVLDEPSIGLHPRDNRRLIETLVKLRDAGNTVLVVEHDQETMEAADVLVDIGPGAGREGGRILSVGPVAQVAHSDGPTGQFLSGREHIAVPKVRRKGNGCALTLRGVRHHNLKNVDVDFPLGTLTVVTGVSGSGKSTLVVDVLHKALALRLHGAHDIPGEFDAIEGLEYIDKVIEIDQSPIGRTPRSNPATYTKLFDPIRDLFAETPQARRRGFSKSRFSFNVSGGRCEACEGSGVKVVEMQFLANVEIPCEVCNGRRFNAETLAVTYKDKSIDEVLNLTVSEGRQFFSNLPRIARILQTMEEVGLGYVPLGQPSTTLSGGEAQRVKLASELHRPSTGRTLYILDEPTTGLHMADVKKLIAALQALVDAGNTVLVIEHNLDLIKVADHLIDMGPEGGGGGGRLVAAGTPEEVAAVADSHSGRFLKALLAAEGHPPSLPAPTPRPVKAVTERALTLRGAHLHNLRHVDVSIPHGKLTVVTGVSGSGKTSLAFDTLFAEGQRRYVESLSTYARRFLGRLDKAPVDAIDGIAPAIAVDQKVAPRNPRSTVATTTEIYDYLRLLYARVGTPHSPINGRPLLKFTPDTAADHLLRERPEIRGEILAPLPPEARKKKKDEGEDEISLRQIQTTSLLTQGFIRLRVDGEPVRLDGPSAPLMVEGRVIEVVTDRLVVREDARARIAEAFEGAFRHGEGVAWFRAEDGSRLGFSVIPADLESGFFLREELNPRMFSFNSHIGACVRCDGLGTVEAIDPSALIFERDRPTLQALAPAARKVLDRRAGRSWQVLQAVAKANGFSLDVPWRSLSPEAQGMVLQGTGERFYKVVDGGKDAANLMWRGVVAILDQFWKDTVGQNDSLRQDVSGLLRDVPCPECRGARLKPLPLSVTVAGRHISDFCRMTVTDAQAFIQTLEFDRSDRLVATPILQEVSSRLKFLVDVGLEYLTLDRASSTLSGGEAQRIRLASQLGSHLVGVLYVLDEPTVGLHPRDTDRLLSTLTGLRDRGNTVLVVEHDQQSIERADWLIDMGPGAGKHGGRVLASGTPGEVERHPESITAAFMRGERAVPTPAQRRTGRPGVWVKGARANNLKEVDVHFPLGQMVCVTGVSGSGKSSLVMDILSRGLSRQLTGAGEAPGEHDQLVLPAELRRVSIIDQSPLGRSPKSNAATYLGVMDLIRDVFAETPEARARGYEKGRFSFNVAGGRCEACEGRGAVKVEMHFLSDVWVPCESCRGRRFNDATLSVTFKGKNIAEVLELEAWQAVDFFQRLPRIRRLIQPLVDVGLGYMSLGQAATTLSGGEAQRVKLAGALLESAETAFYVLDEPTTGLHFADVEKLVSVFHQLVDRGHTVVVIEHNPDVMRVADHVIDMGPEGGQRGGRVVAEGTPEQVAAHPTSYTGRFLRIALEEHPPRSEPPALGQVGA